MYVMVYAPNGEPFEVTRDRADRLILQEGWTQSQPVIELTAPPVEEPVASDADEDDQPTNITSARKSPRIATTRS
jgi:hypothetical protein